MAVEYKYLGDVGPMAGFLENDLEGLIQKARRDYELSPELIAVTLIRSAQLVSRDCQALEGVDGLPWDDLVASLAASLP